MRCLEQANSQRQSRIEVTRCWGRWKCEGESSSLFSIGTVSIWDDEKTLEIDGGDGYTTK
jgi:hypothetical protein